MNSDKNQEHRNLKRYIAATSLRALEGVEHMIFIKHSIRANIFQISVVYFMYSAKLALCKFLAPNSHEYHEA